MNGKHWANTIFYLPNHPGQTKPKLVLGAARAFSKPLDETAYRSPKADTILKASNQLN
jgi:hypothetical protein